jgi:hypothetical protein
LFKDDGIGRGATPGATAGSDIVQKGAREDSMGAEKKEGS